MKDERCSCDKSKCCRCGKECACKKLTSPVENSGSTKKMNLKDGQVIEGRNFNLND